MRVEQKVIQRLVKRLICVSSGRAAVIHGLWCEVSNGIFQARKFLNPEDELYQTNNLSVTRQLYYERVGKNSLTWCFFEWSADRYHLSLKNQFSSVGRERQKAVCMTEPKRTDIPLRKERWFTLLWIPMKPIHDNQTRWQEHPLFAVQFRLQQRCWCNPPNPNGYRTALFVGTGLDKGQFHGHYR